MSVNKKDAERAVAVLEHWLERGAAKTLVYNALTVASIRRVIKDLEEDNFETPTRKDFEVVRDGLVYPQCGCYVDHHPQCVGGSEASDALDRIEAEVYR